MPNRPTPASVTAADLDRLPMTLGADVVMGLYLKGSYAALLRDVHLGHVPPPKFQRPMRWHKPDIKAHFANPRKFKRKTSRKPS
jgi:hypothetical protein